MKVNYMLYDELFLPIDLPEPLSQEEILKYFNEFWAKDESAKEMIIFYNTRLIYQLYLISLNIILLIKKKWYKKDF